MIKLNEKKQLLRLVCGQCGDAKDIIIDLVNGEVEVAIQNSIDFTLEPEGEHCFLQPVEIIV